MCTSLSIKGYGQSLFSCFLYSMAFCPEDRQPISNEDVSNVLTSLSTMLDRQMSETSK